MSTVSNTITHGITLSVAGSYTSPLTVTSSGYINNSTDNNSIYGPGPQNWAIENQGHIVNTSTSGGGNGVNLSQGGSVSNSGTIRATRNGVTIGSAAGTVTNSGLIVGTTSIAVNLGYGGIISNSSTGVIQGSLSGAYIGGTAGTVVNSGTITANGTIGGSGNAVWLSRGGLVENASGGLIQGQHDGIFFTLAGSVTNAGTISATNYGIDAWGGGTFTNASGGLIQGTTGGFSALSSAVLMNSGTITGRLGVVLNSGGTLINNVDGRVQGTSDAVFVSQPGTITNFGQLIGSGTSGNGIALQGGGLLNNAVGALVVGNNYGMYAVSATSVVNAGTIAGGSGSGVWLIAGGTVQNSGTIGGTSAAVKFDGTGGNLLVLQNGYKFNGAVIAAGTNNTLELLGNSGSTVTVAYSNFVSSHFQNLMFGPNGNARLVVSTTGSLGATISGFDQTSEIIDLTGVGANGTISSFDTATDQITVTGSLGSVTLQFASIDGFNYSTVSDGSNGTELIACYCRGTMIRTPTGEVPIEQLAIGDLVTTFSDESRPIRWIGRRAYSGRFIEGNRGVLPICIKANAVAAGMPSRDLWLSPEHSLYIDHVLVQAKDLVNGGSIVQAESVAEVEYFHIELESHDVIYADGTPAETFVDCDNRLMFANSQEYVRLYPGDERRPWQFSAPRLEAKSTALAAIRAALSGRASALGYFDEEPGLHLLVDGTAVWPQRISARCYRFVIAAETEDLWLRSSSWVPAETEAESNDIRHLGVAVERFVMRDADTLLEINHRHPSLGDGFYAAEDGNRWTTGVARLPRALLHPFTGTVSVDIHLAATAALYRRSGPTPLPHEPEMTTHALVSTGLAGFSPPPSARSAG